MPPAPCVPFEDEPAPLIAPGATLADILAGLAARMDAAQRHAFLSKMASLDRQCTDALTVTLGSA